MTTLPKVTILLGPQTRLSLALNAHLRENRQYLRARGLIILPSRVASPLVRRILDKRPVDERIADFKSATEQGTAILSAINMFGPPQAGLAKGELFPDAELTLAGLDPVVGDARIVLALDELPELFLAAKSEAFEERVRNTSWEVLYELSWHDLVSELVDLLPTASFLILTGARAGEDLQRLEAALLGEQTGKLPQPYTLLRNLISETGVAVLDRMLSRGTPDHETLADLYKSFAVKASLPEQKEKLGLDKVTSILLTQRFEEDLEQISTLPRVTVF